MSLISSMYTSANGLEAHSDAMNVVSDNIANVNTVGYKQGQARFADIIASTPDIAPNGKLGQGSTMAGVSVAYNQGALLATGQATDVALQGGGFFMIKGPFNGNEGTYYSRAGQFHIDNTGALVNADGLAVQGYNAKIGQLEDNIASMQIMTNSILPPSPTSAVTVVANLDYNAPVNTAFDPVNPSTTSNFSTSVTMYDSLGAAHNVDIYFRNQGAGTYEWHAMAAGAEVSGGTPGAPFEIDGGTLVFDDTGKLTTVNDNGPNINFNNAVGGQTVTFNFGDATNNGGTGLQGITSYAGSSTVASVQQDGYTEGALTGITINGAGVVSGRYTNGITQTVGQLAVATFTKEQGLERVGNQLYVANPTSGPPAVGAAATGGRGTIAAGSLEQSNVNLSQEFINLMTYERGFQANTRSVHSADEMLQELVNLRR